MYIGVYADKQAYTNKCDPVCEKRLGVYRDQKFSVIPHSQVTLQVAKYRQFKVKSIALWHGVI